MILTLPASRFRLKQTAQFYISCYVCCYRTSWNVSLDTYFWCGEKGITHAHNPPPTRSPRPLTRISDIYSWLRKKGLVILHFRFREKGSNQCVLISGGASIKPTHARMHKGEDRRGLERPKESFRTEGVWWTRREFRRDGGEGGETQALRDDGTAATPSWSPRQQRLLLNRNDA